MPETKPLVFKAIQVGRLVRQNATAPHRSDRYWRVEQIMTLYAVKAPLAGPGYKLVDPSVGKNNPDAQPVRCARLGRADHMHVNGSRRTKNLGEQWFPLGVLTLIQPTEEGWLDQHGN